MTPVTFLVVTFYGTRKARWSLNALLNTKKVTLVTFLVVTFYGTCKARWSLNALLSTKNVTTRNISYMSYLKVEKYLFFVII